MTTTIKTDMTVCARVLRRNDTIINTDTNCVLKYKGKITNTFNIDMIVY